MGKEILDKVIDYLMPLLVLILGLFLLQKCGENNRLENNLQVEIDNVRTYKDKNGELIEYNDVISTKYKDLELYNEELKNEIENMKIKNPEVIIRTTTELRVDTVYVEFTDTLPCDDFVKNIEIDSAWYNIGMTLTKESLTIDSMSFPNESIITVGEKKNGIFKKNEYIVAVKNSNPHIQTDTLETYSFKKDRKFFERPSVLISGGAILMFAVMKLVEKL
jgi:hypothetical protein